MLEVFRRYIENSSGPLVRFVQLRGSKILNHANAMALHATAGVLSTMRNFARYSAGADRHDFGLRQVSEGFILLHMEQVFQV